MGERLIVFAAAFILLALAAWEAGRMINGGDE